MSPAAPLYLAVGRIGRAHGIRGEVCVDVLTEFPERFAPGSTLYVGPERGTTPSPMVVESARPFRDRLLVHLDAAADRDAAQALTGLYLFIPASEAHPLEADSFYAYQLVGLEVVTDAGQPVGRVAHVMETGSADVLEVHGSRGTTLIPMIGDVVAEIDLSAGRITITPLPGLLDEG